jgi:dTDP-4-amino-4,6-dideoxygalactose transaminase
MKTRIDDLAVFGGAPAFPEPLHVGRPNIGDRQRLRERFDEILDNRWLTNGGPFVKAFEKRLQEMTGAAHCIPICNGTVALEIAMRALGMTGEVIVPSFTFIATVHALQWQEITPVFADVDPVWHHLDPDSVESMITPRTTGIIGVHTWGNACNVERLTEVAARRKLRLLFDAAHAFGCTHNGRMIGNFGDAEVFSFHATKFVNTFEGGAIVTNNDELAARIRLMKNFGFSGQYDDVRYIGTNGKMNEFSAAMGVTSLESMEDFVEACRRNHERYQRELRVVKGIRFVPFRASERHNRQYVILEVDQDEFGMSRDDLVRVLHSERILARRYFHPGCHRMEPYRTLFPHAGALLPVTETVCRRVFVLPTGTGVTEKMAQAVSSVIRLAGSDPARVKRALG